MTVDDNNENSTPNTGPTNHKISPGALLISAALENGFVKLDQKEQLIRRVIYILLIVSSVALPFIAFFSWELASTMKDTMNTNMAAMKESMGDMKDDMDTMTSYMEGMNGHMDNMDDSMATMNRTMQTMTGHVSMMDLGMRNMNYSVHEMDHTMWDPKRSISNMAPWRW